MGEVVRVPYRLNHRIIGWKRPLRSSSPTINRTPPCLLNHVPKCHIYTFFEHLQGWWHNHFPGQPIPMPPFLVVPLLVTWEKRPRSESLQLPFRGDPKRLITVTAGTHGVHVCLYVGVHKGVCTSNCSGTVGSGGLACPGASSWETRHPEPVTG